MAQSQEMVTVEQVDRALFNALFHIPERRQAEVLAGTQDETEEMQAIARHREAEAARTEKHRNDLADKNVAHRIEIGALNTRLRAERERCARIAEHLAADLAADVEGEENIALAALHQASATAASWIAKAIRGEARPA